MIGQGIVLMVAGMGIVYAFLYLLIAVSELASRFVPRFDFMVAGGEQKKQTKKLKSQPLAHLRFRRAECCEGRGNRKDGRCNSGRAPRTLHVSSGRSRLFACLTAESMSEFFRNIK